MKKIRILVTGLCLSRNRGGPAMALSFMNQIGKYLPADFTIAVDPRYLALEREWGERYAAEVVPRDSILRAITQSSLLRRTFRLVRHRQAKGTERCDESLFWHSVHKQYIDAFQRADCVVNLNGVAFVGDSTRSWISSLSQRTDSIYGKKLKKPFLRFIQSYGPFLDWRVKLIAKWEFKRLPFIMARGRLSGNYCRRVTNTVPVYAFPDVAITLPSADNSWLHDYLRQFDLKLNDYIALSPSAVMATFPNKSHWSLGDRYIEVYVALVRHYISIKQPMLFVPHATSPDLNACDRVICNRVLEVVARDGTDTGFCHIVEDELDCRELKALIRGAQLAIVSRYHALVAAASAGVPVISIGWNEKYQDLMDFYGSSEFAVDARMAEPGIIVDEVLAKIDAWTNERIVLLRNKQPELEDMIEKATKICVDWIVNVIR